VVYVQAKRYATDRKVGRPDIQGFVGALHGAQATRGIFITTSSFSADARIYAERVNARIVLIDGPELAQLMVEHNCGVRVEETFVLKSGRGPLRRSVGMARKAYPKPADGSSRYALGARDGGAMQDSWDSAARLERDTAGQSSGAAGTEAARMVPKRLRRICYRRYIWTCVTTLATPRR
jgi:Restriction endonuclease